MEKNHPDYGKIVAALEQWHPDSSNNVYYKKVMETLLLHWILCTHSVNITNKFYTSIYIHTTMRCILVQVHANSFPISHTWIKSIIILNLCISVYRGRQCILVEMVGTRNVGLIVI